MNKLSRTLRQLHSLARLRAMQKAQSAAQLADANKVLNEAEMALHRAHGRYQLALEVQRRNRANGQEIDPVLYGYQFDSTDHVREAVIEHADKRNLANESQQRAMATFVSHHSQHKVVRSAENDTRAELAQRVGARELIDAQDQAGRTRHLVEEQ